jgi:DNA replication protein DnaC
MDNHSNVNQNEEVLKLRYNSAGILPRWRADDVSLDKFEGDTEALKSVRDYLTNIKTLTEKGIGLYLYGSNGVGKTYLLNSLFKGIIGRGTQASVRVISLSSLINLHALAWGDSAAGIEFKKLRNMRYVGIEEIGKEFNSERSTLAATVLDNFLRHRSQKLLPTFFTSNLVPSEIANRYTDDILSLLKEMTVSVLVKGGDFRNTLVSRNKAILSHQETTQINEI